MPESDGSVPVYLAAASRVDFDNIRADLRDHEERDRGDFRELRDSIIAIKATVDHWEGALGLIKLFTIVGGGSAIGSLGVLVVHVLRHWN